MKRILNSIYPLFLIASLFGSCAKELEKSPLDQFASETFWASEGNALLALNGVYRGNILVNAPEYNPTDWWSYNGLLFWNLLRTTLMTAGVTMRQHISLRMEPIRLPMRSLLTTG